MNGKLIKLLFVACLLLGCREKVDYLTIKSDFTQNSLNCGLIEINNDCLFLNKANNITTYNFAGNQLKIIEKYDRESYNTIAVSDSLLLLSKGRLIIYKITGFNAITQVYGAWFNFPMSEIELIDDSTLIVLNGRFNTQPDETSNNPARTLHQVNYKSIINANRSFIGSASSFTVMNDSIVFFMNNNISRFNINDKPFRTEVVWLGQNRDNEITTTISKENELFTSNSKSIFFFDYLNDNLVLKGEIR